MLLSDFGCKCESVESFQAMDSCLLMSGRTLQTWNKEGNIDKIESHIISVNINMDKPFFSLYCGLFSHKHIL